MSKNWLNCTKIKRKNIFFLLQLAAFQPPPLLFIPMYFESNLLINIFFLCLRNWASLLKKISFTAISISLIMWPFWLKCKICYKTMRSDHLWNEMNIYESSWNKYWSKAKTFMKQKNMKLWRNIWLKITIYFVHNSSLLVIREELFLLSFYHCDSVFSLVIVHLNLC